MQSIAIEELDHAKEGEKSRNTVLTGEWGCERHTTTKGTQNVGHPSWTEETVRPWETL